MIVTCTIDGNQC